MIAPMLRRATTVQRTHGVRRTTGAVTGIGPYDITVKKAPISLARPPLAWKNGFGRTMRIRVLGIVLAGGKGTRLYPLTKERAKPAVPFGGKYRIIDFVLSNFINSGIHSIYVLTQFRSQSLLQHLSEGWQFGSLLKTEFIIPVRS